MSRRPLVVLASAFVVALAGGCGSNGAGSSNAASDADTTTTSSPVDSVGPGEDWLVYESETFDIMLVRPDGTASHSPTADVPGGFQTNPDWSPDGEQLVFAVTADDDTDDLWTVQADGTGAKRLLDCTDPCLYLDDPAWSPDGSSVVFSRLIDDGGNTVGTLEVVDVDTGETRVLLTGRPGTGYAGPRWSPDGDAIVVEVVHQASPELDAEIEGVTLSVLDPDDAEASLKAITEPALFAATADWSPDGDEIVYSARPDAGAFTPDLFAIHPDGSSGRRLTTLSDTGGVAEHPTYAPDGKSVTFVLHLPSGGGNGLATIPVAGGNPKPLIGQDYVPALHPRHRPRT